MSVKYIIDNADSSLSEQIITGDLLVTNIISGTTFFGDGSGLTGVSGAFTGGTQYILVKAEGTDIENAAELQTAYDLAVSLSASSTNRITIVASPGNYNFSASTFTMDTEYIDLVSLDSNRSIIFNSTDNDGTISVEADNTLVKGVDVLTKPFNIGHDLGDLVIENCKGGNNSFGYTTGAELTVGGTFINCVGGNNSFGSRVSGTGSVTLTLSGKFIDCVAGSQSFGFFFSVSQQNTLNITDAEFINCQSGPSSFGSGSNSGAGSSISILGSKFINCKSSGANSFGVSTVNQISTLVIDSSGNNDFQTVFENCEAFGPSFGSKSLTNLATNVTVGGNPGFIGVNPYRVLFKNCVSKFFFSSPPQLTGIASFGGFGTLSFVELINCKAGNDSFGSGGDIVSSRLENCVGGDNSFGKNNLSGTFINCVAGNNSFAYVNNGVTSTINGTFIDCVAGNNSFGHRPNIGGDSQINLNINGTFTNCTAGNNSFGYNTNNQVGSPTTLTFNNAKLTNCKAGDNSFGVHISPRAISVTQFNFSEFNNCKSGVESFGYINNGDGTIQSTFNLTIFENCKAGDYSFCTGIFGTSAVIFKNCEGGNFSFFGDGTLTGKFENCVAELGSFGNFGTASGTFTNCQGGDGSFGNFGTASGTFTNCVGGNGSFGGDGTLSGKLYYCRLTSGAFETPTGSGKIVLGIDGDDNVINLTA